MDSDCMKTLEAHREEIVNEILEKTNKYSKEELMKEYIVCLMQIHYDEVFLKEGR